LSQRWPQKSDGDVDFVSGESEKSSMAKPVASEKSKPSPEAPPNKKTVGRRQCRWTRYLVPPETAVDVPSNTKLSSEAMSNPLASLKGWKNDHKLEKEMTDAESSRIGSGNT
jgi:hypothetical protein